MIGGLLTTFTSKEILTHIQDIMENIGKATLFFEGKNTGIQSICLIMSM